ncbi:hypothetical protein ABMA32_12960 [Mesorhizobium sp. VNQ89]|uniref:hypothetical protein n=1 Tax=Mesorhizobium quangtriensis TaxID=3157709 RepID=UPI0032B7EDA7
MDIIDKEIIRKLKNMRGEIAAHTLLTQAKHLHLLAAKAGFRPNQPRVPAGNSDGGQWVGEGLAGSEQAPRLWLAGDRPELPPDVPEREPPTIRERNAWGVRVAKYLATTSHTFAASVFANWLIRHADHRIRAYLTPPKTLQELQDMAFDRPAGFDIHHIVEQTPARNDGFSNDKIESWENRVAVPTYRHWEITGWYQTKNDDFGDLSPREYLRDQPWDIRRAVGMQALKIHGVLKP